tara:strand:- start:542 stop:1363 length:822 start_codon:yes stop_codon:yes gene_type:complete
MKNIVVATKKNVGYYNILKQSCKIHNIELVTLGLGQKWTHFILKFDLWLEYLNKLDDDNEIVMINDAYDVIMLQNSNTILKKFKQFNKKIIFGIQDGFFTNIIFNKCKEYVICSGNIIGYVKYLKKFIQLIFKHKNIWKKNNNDDQIIVNNICEIERPFFIKYTSIDKHQKIFFTTTGDQNYVLSYLINSDINGLKMKNKKLYNKNNIQPSVLHLGGNIDGNKYLKYIGYNVNDIQIHGFYKVKQMIAFLISVLKKYMLMILLVILIYHYYFN